MVTMNQIEEVGPRIGREFAADRVVPFGSYADGMSDENATRWASRPV